MERNQMFCNIRDIVGFATINVVGVVISLSDIEQWIRIATGIAVLVYSIAKAVTAVRSLQSDGPKKH